MILVVDDDPGVCAFLQAGLQRAGYDVEIASDGQIALEMLKENTYQLVLMDIHLPGLDGFELFRELHENDEVDLVPIIGMTGGSEKLPGWYAGKALKMIGVPTVLNKPFLIDEVLAAIEALPHDPSAP